MFNRIFITAASILCNLLLGYAHLSVYWKRLQGKQELIPEGIAQFHGTEPQLSSGQLLFFGIVFLVLGTVSITCAVRSNHRVVFYSFVACMFMIWIRLWVGGV